MRLNRVDIQNFRSISDITINFDPQCRVLVGINESGKTNILKALSLLDLEKKVNDDDLRESATNEDVVKEGFVRFVFTLDQEEKDKAYENFSKKVWGNFESRPIIEINKNKLTLSEYFNYKVETLYKISINNKTRSFIIWAEPNYAILEGWRKPSKASTIQVRSSATKEAVSIQNYSLLYTDSGIADESKSLLKGNTDKVTSNELNLLVGSAINEVIKPLLPKCVFWEYKESNLLPSQINIETFKETPEFCLPMKHMFALAGHSKVKSSIEEAQKRANGLRNLLKRVSDLSTQHLHKVWKDYRNIRLELMLNGDNIDAHVQDTYNTFNFSRRSDGFKRFVTFLLLISAKAEMNELTNTLYLHDEPEVSLHPSGAKHLRDELIKISQNNLVLYSTHSIFMIDNNVINRHLIVEKENEITEIKEVDVSNMVDEEVIYNALGHSIFENLKLKNIVFEGWRDKKLFQFAIEHLPSKYKRLDKVFSEVGFCHVKGVKDIGRITPMLELAGRECLIISDSDKPAIEQQSKYEGYGLWLRYDEIINDKSVVTAEDFIKPEAFSSELQKIMTNNSTLPDLPIKDLENSNGRLYIIQKWLEGNGVTKENSKKILDELKGNLISNLKASHLEPKYFVLLDEIAQRL